jgi:hypothetical protein
MVRSMRVFPARMRYWCALLLICAGGIGVLFAPSVGLFGSQELRSFTINQTREEDWGIAIVSSEFELPFVRNERGLLFMNVFLAGSLGAIFGGVHWFAGLRRAARQMSK